MPTYSYGCDKCGEKFELFFFIKDYQESPKCLHCNSKKTHRNYMLDVATQITSVKKSDDQLTLGELADRNRDRFSDDHKSRLQKKHYDYRQKGALPKGMKRMNTDQTVKWSDNSQKVRRKKNPRKKI